MVELPMSADSIVSGTANFPVLVSGGAPIGFQLINPIVWLDGYLQLLVSLLSQNTKCQRTLHCLGLDCDFWK